jgi:hypothetical protein
VPTRDYVRGVLRLNTGSFVDIHTAALGNCLWCCDNLEVFCRAWPGSSQPGHMLHAVSHYWLGLPAEHPAWLLAPPSLRVTRGTEDLGSLVLSPEQWREEQKAAVRLANLAVAAPNHGRLGFLVDPPAVAVVKIFIGRPLDQGVMSWADCHQLLMWHRDCRLATSGILRDAATGAAYTTPAVQPVVVDGQLYLRLARILDADQVGLFKQVVLVPGGLHWLFHVVNAIYIIWAPWLLSWAHGCLGRAGQFDKTTKSFSRSENLLEVVSTAVLLWATDYLGARPDTTAGPTCWPTPWARGGHRAPVVPQGVGPALLPLAGALPLAHRQRRADEGGHGLLAGPFPGRQEVQLRGDHAALGAATQLAASGGGRPGAEPLPRWSLVRK